MYYYNIYGLLIKSDYEFEEACKAVAINEENVNIIIKSGIVDKSISDEKENEGQKGFGYTFLAEKSYGWVRCFNQGAFVITNGKNVTYQLKEECNKLMANEIFLCLVIPMALIQRNMVMIHGSCVKWNNRTFIITGKSGSGKSTLTKELICCGGKFLADDTVALKRKNEGYYAQYAYPQQKLSLDMIFEGKSEKSKMILLPDDGGIEKYGVRQPENFCKHEQFLNAIFEIEKDEAVSEPVIVEITGSEKINYIINNMYKLDVYKIAGVINNLFTEIVKIAGQTKIFSIKRPAQGMSVEKQRNLIESVLDNL